MNLCKNIMLFFQVVTKKLLMSRCFCNETQFSLILVFEGTLLYLSSMFINEYYIITKFILIRYNQICNQYIRYYIEEEQKI